MDVHPHQDFKLMKEQEKLNPFPSLCPPSEQPQKVLRIVIKHMDKEALTFHHHHIWLVLQLMDRMKILVQYK